MLQCCSPLYNGQGHQEPHCWLWLHQLLQQVCLLALLSSCSEGAPNVAVCLFTEPHLSPNKGLALA